MLALIAGSGFYSGMEIAVVSARRSRLERHQEEGSREARAALELLENTPRTLAAILVGNNLCNIGAASLATALAVAIWPQNGPAIATILLTPVVLFGAELLPKAFVSARPTRSLRIASGALRVSATLLSPLVTLTSGATRAFLSLLPIAEAEKRPVFEREELENVFMYGAVRDDTPGARPAAHGDAALRMAGRALDLRRRNVSHAIIPLPDERTCPGSATVRAARERFRAARGRYLAALDAEGRVTGFVAAKALLGEPDDRPLEELVHPALLLDLDDSLDSVLQDFRSHQPAIGLVRDADGRTLGVVTAEGVFEEVVGELTRLGSSSWPVVPAPEEKR
jgi:CBS domain containing-hemolysin-like protein